MVRKSMLTTGVAVILGGVLAATPAGAGAPTINVVDDPHDVHIMSATIPGVTVTEAERRSVEIYWFKATPRTDQTVRFRFKIDEVRGNARFTEFIHIFMETVSTSTGTWDYAVVNMRIGPNAPAPTVYIGYPTTTIECEPLTQVNRATDTVSIDVPSTCVPVGDLNLILTAETAIVPNSNHGGADTSRDKVRLYRVAIR